MPSGIFIFTFPSNVGIWISPPNAASMKLIGASQYRCLPSRSNTSCGKTLIWTNKSPEGPPFIPASPSPESLILSPVSHPQGFSQIKFYVFLLDPDLCMICRDYL